MSRIGECLRCGVRFKLDYERSMGLAYCSVCLDLTDNKPVDPPSPTKGSMHMVLTLDVEYRYDPETKLYAITIPMLPGVASCCDTLIAVADTAHDAALVYLATLAAHYDDHHSYD